MPHAKQRYINGKVYFLEGMAKTKTSAKQQAKTLRNSGKLARIEKTKKPTPTGSRYRIFAGRKNQ